MSFTEASPPRWPVVIKRGEPSTPRPPKESTYKRNHTKHNNAFSQNPIKKNRSRCKASIVIPEFSNVIVANAWIQHAILDEKSLLQNESRKIARQAKANLKLLRYHSAKYQALIRNYNDIPAILRVYAYALGVQKEPVLTDAEKLNAWYNSIVQRIDLFFTKYKQILPEHVIDTFTVYRQRCVERSTSCEK